MNQKTQIEIVKSLQEKEINILQSKGNDYADTDDVLKNFKQVSEICKILNIDSRTLYGTHMFYIVLKIQRICNLLAENKVAQNESLDDSFLDLRAYVGLVACATKE
jgi:hypothetical protein